LWDELRHDNGSREEIGLNDGVDFALDNDNGSESEREEEDRMRLH
jgi:hypothetical protein